MDDLGNIQAVCVGIFYTLKRLQGEQNLKMMIKQYIEGFYSPISLKLLSPEVIRPWISSMNLIKLSL
jgi:hypothetical protein